VTTDSNRSPLFWVITCLFCYAPDPSSAGEQGRVRIAAVFPQTGIAAEYSKPSINAAHIAVAEINRQGGLFNSPVELVLLDSQSSPLSSKLAAEKAPELGVTAVVGPIWSSHCFPMAKVLQQAKIPMITPTATNPDVTLVGNYIFRVCFTDDFQGSLIARFAFNDLGTRTAVVMVNTSEEYSITLARFFTKSFQEMGGKVLWERDYKSFTADFSSLLNETKRLTPDVVFIPGYARDSGLLVKQAVKMGIRTRFLGGDGWSHRILGYGGTALDGTFYSTHWHPDLLSKENQRLQQVYLREYGRDNFQEPQIALTYDALMLLASAIRRAGSLDRARIRDALAKTDKFEGTSGTITFDENRNPVNKSGHIVQFENGQLRLFSTITP
jgi:branched-chain amino acid transport system substrate-binding protein